MDLGVRDQGYLVGQQSIQGWTAFTLEEAMDAQIERIEGKSTDKRPNELERVDRIEQECLAAIAAWINGLGNGYTAEIVRGYCNTDRQIGRQASDKPGRLCYAPPSPQLDPWCSGPTCQPVTLEIAGSNPVGSASPTDPCSVLLPSTNARRGASTR